LSRAEAEVESLRKELAEARAWKERMIAVCPPLQEIGRELNVGLGDSIHDKILPGIVALKRSLGEMCKALRLAKTRLEICLGRMRACNLEGSELSHEVSLQEIPAWIEDMETLLSRKEKSSGDDGTK